MELSVKNRNGEVVGSVDLSERVWSTPPNDALLQQVVVAQLANRRQGTHETKTRGQVRYSTRKLRGQKHSGQARVGSRKSPTMVGGGVIFGPHTRSYRQRLTKKMRRQALRIALSDKVREERLTVLDEFDLDAPKTRYVADLVAALRLHGSTLLVVEDIDRDLMLSARGAQRVDLIYADGLNATSAVKATNIVATRGAIDRIESLWDDSKVEAEAAR
jgi:large subunit ribosomal protein L4